MRGTRPVSVSARKIFRLNHCPHRDPAAGIISAVGKWAGALGSWVMTGLGYNICASIQTIEIVHLRSQNPGVTDDRGRPSDEKWHRRQAVRPVENEPDRA